DGVQSRRKRARVAFPVSLPSGMLGAEGLGSRYGSEARERVALAGVVEHDLYRLADADTVRGALDHIGQASRTLLALDVRPHVLPGLSILRQVGLPASIHREGIDRSPT